MRIIAGSRKGFKIRLPRDSGARPLTDRIKESVFAILSDKLEGSAVLDLFAGAGGFGLEALSRGAGAAVFVDSSPACASAIRQNLKRLGLEGEVFCESAASAVKKLSSRGGKFDIIFVDPPFDGAKEHIENTLEALLILRLLSPAGLVSARCRFKTVLAEPPRGLECLREKRYGESRVFFYAGAE